MAIINSYASMNLLKKLFPTFDNVKDAVTSNRPRNWRVAKDLPRTYIADGNTKFFVSITEGKHDFPQEYGTVVTIPMTSTSVVPYGTYQFFLPYLTNSSIYFRSCKYAQTDEWSEWFELLTTKKANETYTKIDDSKSVQVNLDVGLSSPFYHLEDGLRVTKQGNVIHLNGGLQHGKNTKYENIAKVPPGYEPKYKTPLNGFYNKASGEFVTIPLLLKPDGNIVMMADRLDTANPTNMYVAGTWNIKQ